MPASTPQEIHFLLERAFNIGDVEAILALYETGAVLVAVGKPVTGHDRNCVLRSLATPSQGMWLSASEILHQ